MENERTNAASKVANNVKMGVPSLPEPTTRPPPPPKVIPKTAAPNTISTNSPMGLNAIDLSTEVIPLKKPPQKPSVMKIQTSSSSTGAAAPTTAKSGKRKEEPIYEAVIPRHELPTVAEMPEPMPKVYDFNQKIK